MVISCPKCKAIIEESTKFCPHCNHDISSNQQQAPTSYAPSGEPGPVQSSQPYSLPPTQKSNNKLVIVICALIIVGVVIGALYFLVLSGDDTQRFIGSWRLTMEGFEEGATSESVWTFYEGGKVKMVTSNLPGSDTTPNIQFSDDNDHYQTTVTSLNGTVIQWADYEINNGQMSLSYDASSADYSSQLFPDIDFSYHFVNDNKFTLSMMFFTVTFTRCSSDMPDMQSGDFGTIQWKDINISLEDSSFGDNEIIWEWITLSRSSVPYSGEHAPEEWGDVQVGDTLSFGEYPFSIFGDIIWIPSGSDITSVYFYQTE